MRVRALLVHAAAMVPVLALSAPAGGPATRSGTVETKAPRIASGTWLNGDSLPGRDLEGRVVVIQFWTFQDRRSMASVPALRALRALLPRADVAVLGVHTPESDREKELIHLTDAVRGLGIDYPIVVDNERVLWNAFRCRKWPTLYVVDRRGIVRHIAAGELRVGTRGWDALLETIGRLRDEAADSTRASGASGAADAPPAPTRSRDR